MNRPRSPGAAAVAVLGVVAFTGAALLGSPAHAQDPPAGSTSFVTSFTPTALRNDFSGWVGMKITMGGAPVTVTAVGRWAAPGNTGTHNVKLVDAATGADVAGAAAGVATAGAPQGAFTFAPLAGPVTLQANTSYYLLSQEVAGGDAWYEYDTHTQSTNVGSVVAAAYSADGSSYISGGSSGMAYGVPTFAYTTADAAPAVTAHPQDQSVAAGATATFTAAASGAPVPTVQWESKPLAGVFAPIGGATDTTLSISGVTAGDDGTEYRAVFTNPSGTATTDPATLTVTAGPPPPSGTAFVTSFTPSRLRNDFSGWVGMRLRGGVGDVTISALGRWVAPGNAGVHQVKLVDAATGADVAGAMASVDTAGKPADAFTYAALPSPVTLRAGVTYYLVSEEQAGRDSWFDYDTVTTTTAAAEHIGVAYSTAADPTGWVTGGTARQSYGVPNFLYGTPPAPPPPSAGTAFVTSFAPSHLRNDFTGWVGMRVTVGTQPMTVRSLGRWVSAGNIGTHTVKLVDAATGADVPGATVTVDTAGAPPGTFAYTPLPAAIVLQANATYYLVSAEQAGGDTWYDFDTVTVTTTDATDAGAVYAVTDGWVHGGTVHQSYGVPNFVYSFNAPPAAADDGPYTVAEDGGALSVPAPGVLGNDADPDAGDTITAQVATFPAHASAFSLTFDGSFSYWPAADFCGADSFTYRARDQLGALSGLATVSIDVTCVNDPPSFTKGPDQTVDEDAGAQTVNPWATGLSVGPANESTQTLSFVIDTNTNPGLFSAGPAIDAAGVLTYTPAANQNGFADITLHVQDSGGGTDTSGQQTFRITVTAVNDPPVITTTAGATTYTENDPATAIDGLATLTDVDNPTVQSVTAAITTGFVAGQDVLAAGVVPGGATVDTATPGTLTISGPGSLADYQAALRQITYHNTSDDPTAGDRTVTFTAGGTPSGTSAPATKTVTVGAVNDPPQATDDGPHSTNEDTLLQVAAPGVLGNDNDGGDGPSPLTAVLVAGPAHAAPAGFTLHADGSFDYTPAANYNGPDSFTYEANDGAADSPTRTVSLTVVSVNDAPAGTDNSLSTPENTPLTITAAHLGFSDPNDSPPDALAGVVVTSLPANGTLKNGATTLAAGDFVPVADLTANNFVFTPTPNLNGSGSFGFRVRDDGGTANGGVDTDASANTITINVTSVNNAPAGTDGAITVLEDVLTPVNASAFGFTDPGDTPPNALAGVRITAAPAGSVLTHANGDPYTLGDLLVPDAGVVALFKAAPDANGSPYGSFTFQVVDDGGTAGGGVDTDPSANTLTINVTPVNDAPSFAKGPDQVAGIDSGLHTVTGWATVISPGPADEAGQVLDFVVTNDNNSLFSVQPAVDATGTLTYTAASPGVLGTATVNVLLHDSGGTADGGVDTSPVQTFTVEIVPNQLPVGAGQTGLETFEETALPITLSATDADGDPLTFSVGTPPAHGSLGAFGAVNCTGSPTSTCTVAVTYTPATDYAGPDSFTFKANDGSGDSAPATISITVKPVNDAPSFTKGPDQTVDEDAGAQTADPWATAVSAGPADEAGQTVTFQVSNNNNGLFAVQPAVSPTGALTYTPLADAFGLATVTITMKDDGGTADGGVDTSAAQTFTITVNPVNDPPSFVKGPDQNVNEDAALQTITGWATAISPGPANEAGQTLTFTASNDNNPLFSTQPGVSSTGTLTYQPAPDAVGSAQVSLTLSDDGGGTNTSPVQTFSITVLAVNDPPTITLSASTPSFTEDGPSPVAVDDGLLVADADDTDLVSGSVTITAGLVPGDVLAFTPAGGISDTNAAPEVLALTGTTSVANWQSVLRSVTFSTTNQDPGTSRTISFTVNDGDVNSASANKSVTVVPVNDAPVLANVEVAALAYTENAAATVVSPGITATDVDSANLVGATVGITSGYVNGEDVLSLGTNPQNGITAAAFDTATGTLTLTGSSSVANYQTALRDVRYANTSQDPTTAARTVSFQVDDGAAASNLSNIVSRTVNVTRVNDAPVGVADAFDALGNTRLLVGLTGTGPRIETAGSVLANDTDVDTPQGNLDALPATVSSANCSGCNNVVIHANGSFTYDPPAGFTGGDTFTYTVRDNDTGDAPSPAQTGTGTVTITVQGPVVWYVDSTPEAGQTGNTGRSHSPFTSTTSLQPSNGSVDDANEIIFVYEGTYTAANGLALQAGQRLLGQPFGLTVDPAGALPSQNLVAAGGANPELRATGTSVAAIGLANDVELQRVNISNSSAANSCTTCTGVRGTAVTAATIGPDTQISGNSGIGFQLLTAAGGNITVGSQISGNGGLAVSVANRSGGTVGFTGQVSSPAGGVSLSSNAGATINFSAGNMSLATGTGTAFAVSGGGVVSVSGTNNALSTTTGTVVDISGASNNNVSIDATITQNGATTTGRAVNVTGHTGGTVSFPKAVSSTGGAGVSLTSNPSTTVTFSSAITLSGANATFVATGTGTLNASNAANVVGNTTPATGPGVRVESTTLGSTLRFTKVSVTGGTSGIVMNNTGTSFGLSVSGTGTTDASGGVIQNTTGVGVALTDTRFTTLKNMVIGDNAATAGQTPNATNTIGGDGIDMVNADDANFDNLKIARTGGHGIDGTRVTNLVLANSEILNAGDGNGEHAFAFNDFSGAPPTQNNLEGTVTVTNTVFDGFAENGIDIENFAGTLNMTVSGARFANNTSTLCGGGTCGENGLLARSDGTSIINLTVNNNGATKTLFDGIDGNGLFFISEGSSSTASTLNVTQTTIQNSKAIGLVLFGGTGDHTSTIQSRLNFTVGGAAGSGVSVTGSNATAVSIQPNGKSIMRGTFSHVTVNGSTVGRGIEVLSDDVSTAVIDINNNTISNTAFNGIFANNGDSGVLDIHIRNNNVSAPLDTAPPSGLAVHGIEINPLAEATTTCLDIAGNTSAGNAASSGAGFRTRQRDPAVFRLERFTGNPTSVSDVQSFLVAQNTSGTASATVGSGYTGVANGACADV